MLLILQHGISVPVDGGANACIGDTFEVGKEALMSGVQKQFAPFLDGRDWFNGGLGSKDGKERGSSDEEREGTHGS